MKQINESVGFDHVGSVEIERIRLIWEPNKETLEEFFEVVCARYPKEEKRIMKGEIRIEFRKPVERLDDKSKRKK